MPELDEVVWERFLTDLEARTDAAERGDLAALEGWTPADVAMPASVEARAARLAERQRALTTALAAELAQARAAERRLKRTTRLVVPGAPPVFIDRPL